ncbi:hypothetical protein [Alicyclobacillus pomorum]|uniref:hypothetical protein n=1 Tax=Alicyclobacillus pomorum TaxID=204470 RepID=UPI000404C39A|nr:hypothetical protein [Alicyclobacillus pomorum]
MGRIIPFPKQAEPSVTTVIVVKTTARNALKQSGPSSMKEAKCWRAKNILNHLTDKPR